MLILGIILGGLMTMIVYSAYMLLIAFTLWMMVDAGKQDRFWWLVIITGVPVIGPAVYYVTEKKHEYAKIEPHHIHTSETEDQHEKTPAYHHAKHAHVDVKEVSLETKQE